MERYTSYQYINDTYIDIIKTQINNLSKYIENTNKGLDKAEKQIKEYENDLIKNIKYSTDYSVESFRILCKYEAKLIQHDIPLMKEHVMIYVNNTKITAQKYQYNLREYNRLIDMINFGKNPDKDDSKILKLTVSDIIDV